VGLAEAFPHRRQRPQASSELVRLLGVTVPDADLERLEPLEFALHQMLALLLGSAAQFSQERLTGVRGPLQAEGAGDSGKSTPLLAQGQGIAVGVASRLPTAAISIFS
jgi:hypothetical protein